MPNRSRGGSSRAHRLDRGKTQNRTLDSGLEGVQATGTESSDRQIRHSHNKFEHIPSISRSSGVERDGDTLKDPDVQEEYRKFLQQKLDAYWKRYGPRPALRILTLRRPRWKAMFLSNFGNSGKGFLLLDVMIVYETSLWLSIIFHSYAQTTAILSPLLPDLYLSVRSTVKGEVFEIISASLRGARFEVPIAKAETGKQEAHRDSDRVQLWFTSRENLGEVVKKDGVDGRWAVKLKK
ncbi:hypothetical protein BJV77DRAFT_1161018 [Russula vinacea]|nr:hypothetical protein BJV77DRAFT_1161018 [Russula vinacea]